MVYYIHMDSLQNLLGAYNSNEPAEIVAIKRYIHETFDAPSSVGLQGETIIIVVANASLANTLRFQISKLRLAAKTDKKIVFRIG